MGDDGGVWEIGDGDPAQPPVGRSAQDRDAMLSTVEGGVMRGECLECMSRLPSAAFDMVLADLPYGTTACAWDAVIPLEPMWRRFYRLLKPGGAIVLTAAPPFTIALAASNLARLSYTWIWDKGVAANFVQAKRMPLRVHEDILVFSHDGRCPSYRPQMAPNPKPKKAPKTSRGGAAIPARGPAAEAWDAGGMADKVYTEKYPSTIIPFSCRADPDRGLHPTQKSIDLFRYLVRTYTDPGALVLDPTAGSGTTGHACLLEGRRFVMVERDPAMAWVASDRLGRVRAEMDQQRAVAEAANAG
jgi:site-specific DNA-methyltransferase (adenine-specific)